MPEIDQNNTKLLILVVFTIAGLLLVLALFTGVSGAIDASVNDSLKVLAILISAILGSQPVE